MRIIAVVNQKGGVGKTTTSVNLGAALALRGRRVLLVDLDPQGNLTDHLLGDPPEGQDRASIYDVLVEGKPILEAVVPTGTPGLHVLPSHEDLAGAELDLASVIGREVLLRDALADLPDGTFDYILLDCPPSLGLLSLNALAAAHEVFIALQTEFFAMRGLGALDRTVDLVRRRINPALRVTGIVPTLVDATRLSREVVDEVRGHYGELVFSSRVRSNIRLAEAPSHGKHIFEYAPDSPGAADYAALAKEVEEGREAVEAPTEVPTVAVVAAPTGDGTRETPGAPTPTPAGAPKPPGPRLRGIARAIQEATADVVAGAGLPRPAPRPAPAPVASVPAPPVAPPAPPATLSPPHHTLPPRAPPFLHPFLDHDCGPRRNAAGPPAFRGAAGPAERVPPAEPATDADAAALDASAAAAPRRTVSDAARAEPHPFEVAGRRLAGLLTRPTGPPRGSVVVAHPHPGHGGHMDHSVVRTLAERAAAAGLVALRFDVGGVRTSVGDVHDRRAHLEELLAAIAVAERLAPGLPRYGAGFSYGARLWMEAVLRPEVPPIAGLLLLAPATRVPKTSRDFGDLLLGRPIRDAALDPQSLARLAAIPVPARILVGANDNVAPPDELRAHAAAIAPVVVIEGVNHFFSRAVGGGATAYDALVPALDAAWTDLVR